MKLAEKFNRPVICFIDTAGASTSIEAEEHGQGRAIAENLIEMMTLKTPIISILIGEGSGSGALALAVADEVWMLENAVYSVISPEACANLLWKDPTRAAEASVYLKLTAEELLTLGVIEKVISEDMRIYKTIRSTLVETVNKSKVFDHKDLTQKRYDRFRKIGGIG